jgi:hypothetical protein
MFKFLFLLLGVFVFLMLIGLVSIGNVFKSFFQVGQPHEKEKKSSYSQSQQKKKIFEEGEGEYVDFEEIKEEKKDADEK